MRESSWLRKRNRCTVGPNQVAKRQIPLFVQGVLNAAILASR